MLTKLVFPLAVVFVFLVLAAQYESWSLPLAIMLIVPMCLLSAMLGMWMIKSRQQHLHPDRLCGARSAWLPRTRSWLSSSPSSWKDQGQEPGGGHGRGVAARGCARSS